MAFESSVFGNGYPLLYSFSSPPFNALVLFIELILKFLMLEVIFTAIIICFSFCFFSHAAM